jgi:hypothetical protein
LRTSECGDAASKRPPSRALLEELAADDPWVAAVDAFRARSPRRHDRIADYESLLEADAHRRVACEVLAQRYRPAPPAERWLNKADGRKKRVFQYQPVDELLFRVVNQLVQPVAAEAASRWCRSFLPGGGARAAFRGVLTHPASSLESKAALRLDVRDYFNSIDVHDLLARLPDSFTSGAIGALLRASLLDPRVERGGAVVDGEPKGIMAGTPLAPILATLYLRDLDREIAESGTVSAYARYSDDILVVAPPAVIPALEQHLRQRLAARGLAVNEDKSSVSAPGEPWDFLGFRYDAGTIGLAPITERKFKAKSTRLARRLLRWRERAGASPERALRAFFRRTNRRTYGTPAAGGDFSWATWFLPMLDRPDGLASLDAHARREGRYAATGRRTARMRGRWPHEVLIDAGHLPLVSAFWAMREGAAYDALVGRRTGLS